MLYLALSSESIYTKANGSGNTGATSFIMAAVYKF
jgi:hypothetical protein